MKKLIIIFLTIFLSIILAGIYGVIHNQLSYSISEEYFTKFKFKQFGFVEYGLNTPRLTSGVIGFWSTWWSGLLVGLVGSLISVILFDISNFKKVIIGYIMRVFATTILFGFIGIIVGKLVLLNLNFNFSIPQEVVHKDNFTVAGTMHNFSYFGGLVGTILGIIYLIKLKRNFQIVKNR